MQSLTTLSHPHRLLVLLIVILLGFALRVYQLEDRSLWADEGWTMLLSSGPRITDVTQTLAADQHPPLFFIGFRLWRNVAGDTEFATRFFSVLINLLAIAGIYQLGRSLFSVSAGLAAALLLALADLPIDLAQEVRHYSLLLTLGIFSSVFYVRWDRHPTRANRIGYVLTSIALLYTHYLGGFILFAQITHMLLTVRPWSRLRWGLFLFGSICLGFLPWWPVVIDQNRLRWENPLYYQNALPNSYATLLVVRNATLGHNATILGGLALLGLVTITTAKHAPRLKVRPLSPTLFLALWIVIMTGITLILNERNQFLTVRNFIIIVPPLLLLAARGLTNLPTLARTFMVTLILVVGLTTVDARRHYPDWRTVTHNVTQFHQSGEPVLMDVWVGDFPVRYYITRQMGSGTPFVSLREWRDQYKGQFLPTLLAYLEERDALWLITWNNTGLDEYGFLLNQTGFQRTATLQYTHDGTPIYSYRYDKLTAATAATFGDIFALRKFDAPTHTDAGSTITVALWWTAEQPIPLDYSVSVFLLDGTDTLVAQHDGPPLNGQAATSTWPTNTLQYDIHQLVVPSFLPPSEYTVGVKVYWYGDAQPLPVGGPIADENFANLGTLIINP